MSRWSCFLSLLILPAALLEYDPPPLHPIGRPIVRAWSPFTVTPRAASAQSAFPSTSVPSASVPSPAVTAPKSCRRCSGEGTLEPITRSGSPQHRSIRGGGVRSTRCRP